MMTNRGGLPMVAWLGLSLTSGCTERGGTIVGHWNLRELAMSDYRITYPQVFEYEDCVYTNAASMDIGSDLTGTRERTFAYDCEGYDPVEYSDELPSSVDVLDPARLYRITFAEGQDPGDGMPDPGSSGGDGASEDEDRFWDCTLDGSKLDCEEEAAVIGGGPPGSSDDPQTEILVWRFRKA